MKKTKFISVLLLAGFLPRVVMAHCPLCTAGAGALVVVGTWLGVPTAVLGVFIGGAAMSMGFWFGNIVKKQYFPYQKQTIAGVIFLSTVFPLAILALDYFPLYISFFGKYGTLFHNTYIVNKFIFGSFIGAGSVVLAPYLSKRITELRENKLPYQGIIISLVLLILVSIFVGIMI